MVLRAGLLPLAEDSSGTPLSAGLGLEEGEATAAPEAGALPWALVEGEALGVGVGVGEPLGISPGEGVLVCGVSGGVAEAAAVRVAPCVARGAAGGEGRGVGEGREVVEGAAVDIAMGGSAPTFIEKPSPRVLVRQVLLSGTEGKKLFSVVQATSDCAKADILRVPSAELRVTLEGAEPGPKLKGWQPPEEDLSSSNIILAIERLPSLPRQSPRAPLELWRYMPV